MNLSHEPGEEKDPELDLLSFGLRYGRVLSRKVARSKGWKPEYFVPRFIADCAKTIGYNGIKFNSSRSYSINLVLFSWTTDSVQSEGEPYIHFYKKPPEDIFDF